MPTPSSPTAADPPREAAWFPEVEAIKAIGIVMVVVSHPARSWLSGGHPSRYELWLSLFGAYCVPCFLFCSGFVTASGRPWSLATTLRRLRRLLTPYLVASLLALLFRSQVLGQDVSPLSDLWLGNAFGAYYYVFLVATLMLVMPLLSRLPRPLFAALTVLLVITGSVRSFSQWMPLLQAAVERSGVESGGSLKYVLRHPAFSWGYFLVGYLFRLEHRRVMAWLSPRRGALMVATWGAVAGIAVATALNDPRGLLYLSWPLLWLQIGALAVTLFGHVRRLGPLVSWLASHSYVLYLYHLFFELAAQRAWPQPARGFDVAPYLLHCALGFAGPAVLVWLARTLLPAAGQRFVGLA